MRFNTNRTSALLLKPKIKTKEMGSLSEASYHKKKTQHRTATTMQLTLRHTCAVVTCFSVWFYAHFQRTYDVNDNENIIYNRINRSACFDLITQFIT